MAARTRIKVPKPKVKASGLAPRTNLKSYTKPKLQGDPMKFGNIGFDLTMPAPTIVQRAKR
jgi:hypothetical protein